MIPGSGSTPSSPVSGPQRYLAGVVAGILGLAASAPAVDVAEVTLERLFSVGRSDETILGQPVDALWFESAGLFVLDGQLMSIEAFDHGGRWMRSIGSSGDGPGQFRIPSGLFVCGKDSIGVVDASGSRIAAYDVEGDLLYDRTIGDAASGDFMTLLDAEFRNDTLATVEKTTRFGPEGLKFEVTITVREKYGQSRVAYREETLLDVRDATLREWEMSRVPAGCWSLTRAARILVAPEFGAFAIDIIDPESERRSRVELPHVAVERGPAILAMMRERSEGLGKAAKSPFSFEPSPTYPVIRSIHAAENGGFWVRVSVPATSGDPLTSPTAELHRFDSDNVHVATVRLLADQDLNRSDFVIGSETLIAISRASEQTPATVSVFRWPHDSGD